MQHPTRLVVAVATAAIAVTTLAPLTAAAAPPDHVLERAREAVTIGVDKARGMSADAPGQVNRAKGLDRAAEAIAAAAERKAARSDGAGPGKGNAFGRGRSAEVAAVLLEGGSPSELPSHGQRVSALAKAFANLKADR